MNARTAREIATALETRIWDSRLSAGERLPTIRSLAAELGVSPMTVATAYRELRRRGLVTAAGRRGTRVSERPPVALPATPAVPAGARDLVSGNPDPDLLPSLPLAEISASPRLYRPEAVLPELAALERALARNVDAVILTPRAQNPVGAAFDVKRARALRAVLSRYPGVLVIEDDHAGAVAGVPALSVCSGPRWAISRSVSKTLGPDLRVAVVAGDAETIARVQGRQMLGTGWVSH